MNFILSWSGIKKKKNPSWIRKTFGIDREYLQITFIRLLPALETPKRHRVYLVDPQLITPAPPTPKGPNAEKHLCDKDHRCNYNRNSRIFALHRTKQESGGNGTRHNPDNQIAGNGWEKPHTHTDTIQQCVTNIVNSSHKQRLIENTSDVVHWQNQNSESLLVLHLNET